jgi:hypothetical protein
VDDGGRYLGAGKFRLTPQCDPHYGCRGRSYPPLRIKQSPTNYNLQSCKYGIAQLIESSAKFSISSAIALSLIYYCVLLLRPGSFLLQDPDPFLHIRTGEWILAHAQLPRIDFYSYTAAGKPWISTEWLSQVAFALAFKLGTWHGVVSLTAIFCAAIFGILCFYLVQNLRFSVAIGWTTLTALAINPHLLARPHVFSYVLMEIWIICLLHFYDTHSFNLRSLFALGPLIALWANVHGSFTFGLALLYTFGGFCFYQSLRKRASFKALQIAIILVTVSACAFLTPYGFRPALMTKELLSSKFTMSGIIEWRPPDFQQLQIQLIFFVFIFSTIAGLGIRMRGARLIAFGIITGFGLSYARGLMMFFILAPFILARPASASVPYLASQLAKTRYPEDNKATDPVLRYLQTRPILVPSICAAIAALVTLSSWWQKVLPPESIAPNAAVTFVKREGITGNVFNDYDFGAYLIFSGIPTFVDGRDSPFGDNLLRKYSDTVNMVNFDNSFKLLDEYKINWIILNPSRPLSRALLQNPEWREVFSDKYTIVFVRH